MDDIKMTHLHVHSSKGSMQDAMTDVDALFKRAKEFGMEALALTDHGTSAAWHTARKASLKYGVKFIPGQEFYFVSDVSDQKEKRKHIVLLAKNEIGYKNMLRLNYEGYVNKQFVAVMGKVFPRIDWALIEKHHEGIICLTACGSGLVSRQMFLHDEDGIWLGESCHTNTIETIKKLKGIFGDDLYLELQPHNLKIVQKNKKTGEIILNKKGEPIVVVDQNHINNMLLKASKSLGVNIVATTDIHYLDKPSAKAHDVLMAISSKAPLSDPNRHRYEVEEFYMKTGKEVHGHFTKYFNSNVADELISNTVRIAEKCEDPKYLDPTGVRFPVFIVKNQNDYNEFENWYKKQPYYNTIREDNAYLRYKCIANFTKMFPHLKGDKRKVYVERIKAELEVLEMHNFCSYILVVADLIEWAEKQHPLAVGRFGRGSAAGVLVGYLLGIHCVDPIEYGLLFERFHNKEKKSYPDIDTDFHPDYRDLVEQYIINKYGKDKVAHVSNLSRMTPKVVIKDIARSLELGGSKSEAFKIANKITDTISPDAKTIDDALSSSKEFRDACKKYPILEEYSKALVGLEKTYATHAAGVIISDVDLTTYVPLRIDKNNVVSVQYEKNQCEEVGLIKMDLLGLEHLKTLGDTIDNARSLGYDCPNKVPDFTDGKVWKEISKGKTLCMFQLESELMQGLCRSIQPKNIEDLAVINALNRPSAAQKPYESRGDKRDWRKIYADRRDGKEKVVYKYKPIEQSFSSTYGICVFEEQLMSIAKYACGWDLNRADQLRKLTKLKEKGKDLAIKLEKEFIEDTMKFSGLTEEQATDIWTNYVEVFSRYGFNKSLHHLETINVFDINGNQTGVLTAEELFKNKNNKEMYVESRDENTKESIFVNIKDVHDHGKIDVYEFELDNGKKVKCTMDHKFRVADGRMLPIKQIIYEDLEIVSM